MLIEYTFRPCLPVGGDDESVVENLFQDWGLAWFAFKSVLSCNIRNEPTPMGRVIL
jgi:hypothetical protein